MHRAIKHILLDHPVKSATPTNQILQAIILDPSKVQIYTDPFPNVFVKSFNEDGCDCTNSSGYYSFSVNQGYRTFIYDIYDVRNPSNKTSYNTKTYGQNVPPEEIYTVIFQNSDLANPKAIYGQVQWNRTAPPKFIEMQLYKTECGSPDSLNKIVKTCDDGNYSFGNVTAQGTYYVKPVCSGCEFTPPRIRHNNIIANIA